ncbi:MAG: hypothetical protein KY460_12145 [Actinobacteria bacterium]|nr:hypothetical protein [Actinomycetota bacterium]
MHTDQQHKTRKSTTSATGARRILTARHRAAALAAASTIALAACGPVPATSTSSQAAQAPAVVADAAETTQRSRNAGPDHLSSRGSAHAAPRRGLDHQQRRPGPDHLE